MSGSRDIELTTNVVRLLIFGLFGLSIKAEFISATFSTFLSRYLRLTIVHRGVGCHKCAI